MRQFFSAPTYDTPENTPRRLGDRLALNTRWYFVWGYLNEIIRGRSEAVRGKYNREAWAESSYRVVKLIEGCGGRLHLRGLENLKKADGPVVFVCNHMSTLETFVLPSIIAPVMEVTFIVKVSLVTHPLFGPVMRSRNPIVVNRQNPREDFQTVMTKGKELLDEGVSIIVFPQHTRSPEFIPEEFNTLGIKLAKSAGVQVIPIAVKTDFWGNGRLIKDLGVVDRSKPIEMVFGEPLSIKGSGKNEHSFIVEFISSHVRKWGGVVLESESPSS